LPIRRWVGVLLAAAFIVAACSPEVAPSPSPVTGGEPTPSVTVYHLETTVWHAGLVLAFHSATATMDPRGGIVDIDARFENPTDDPLTVTSPIRLTAGGQGFELSRDTKLGDIPGHGATEVTLSFDVIGRSNVEDAVLRIGESERHQALIPFRPGLVPTVTLEPRAIEAKGVATAGDLRLTLKSAEQRWDLPDWLEELATSAQALTVTYDVAYRGSFGGGFAFTADNIALQLPDGSTIAPRRDGRSQSVVLIGAGKTVAAQFSRFEIPASVSGPVRLVLKNGSATATLALTIPPG
jgi:hypothetical protein